MSQKTRRSRKIQRLAIVRCPSRKRDYGGRKFAAQVADKIRRESGEHVSAYHCNDCHGWHVGHPIGMNTIPGPTFDPKTGRNRPVVAG